MADFVATTCDWPVHTSAISNFELLELPQNISPTAGSDAFNAMHIPVFRVFYSTTFTILLIVLVGLLLVTTGDSIYQSYRNNQLWNVIVIAGAYALTALIAAFFYATRIYTTRTHLASIPKDYIPIRKGDIRKSVRRIITKGLERSARIAYNAHPRDLTQDEEPTYAEAAAMGVEVQDLNSTLRTPTWGTVAHPGWSSPSSPELPNVHYELVILELGHLIEAKAVSLAPPDPLSEAFTASAASAQPTPVLPDPVAVALLQRPRSMNLRNYLTKLASLGMLSDPVTSTSFLTQYEHARFSSESLTEPEFRSLMTTFSRLLRSMLTPDSASLAAAAANSSLFSMTSSSSSSSTSSLRSHSRASSLVQKLDPTLSMPQPAALTPGPYQTPFQRPYPASADTPGPYQTPFQKPYPASVSSNDGDRDDSGSERSTHTAWTRPSRTPRPGQTPLPGHRSVSRYTMASSAYQTPGVNSRSSSVQSGGSPASGGSVIRRVRTEDSAVDGDGVSVLSGGSVVVRRGEGEGDLPLPFEVGENEAGIGLEGLGIE